MKTGGRPAFIRRAAAKRERRKPMENFLNERALREAGARARRYTRILWGLVLGGLLLFVVLCLLTRTGNARMMLILSWAVLIPLGWGILLFRMLREEPARAEARHLRGLAEQTPETLEGRLTLRDESFRIPKSVRAVSVLLETEEKAMSLNLNERLRDRMPPDGSRVRVQVVSRFITALEVLEPGPQQADRPRASRRGTLLRTVSRFFPAAVLWAMAAVIGTGFVFSLRTETDPEHKIVIFADCEIRNAAGLAEQLEKGLDGAVRMVKIHPFSYVMFDGEQLKSGDLFLVPDSRLDQYAEWFRPLADTPKEGFPVFDPDSRLTVAGDWFQYAPDGTEPEPWRLYFGADSPHREDGLALRAAELLLALRNEPDTPAKQENP